MSDNEGYEEINYFNRESIARGSSTSKRSNNLHSPRYDYSLETNFAGEITIRRLNVPASSNEIVSYKNERKSNQSSRGQSPSTKQQQAIEIETINNDHDDDGDSHGNGDENTHHTVNIESNEIQLQCLECIRSQQNSRQQQQQQQQYATEYSEPSSPKKKVIFVNMGAHDGNDAPDEQFEE